MMSGISSRSGRRGSLRARRLARAPRRSRGAVVARSWVENAALSSGSRLAAVASPRKTAICCLAASSNSGTAAIIASRSPPSEPVSGASMGAALRARPRRRRRRARPWTASGGRALPCRRGRERRSRPCSGGRSRARPGRRARPAGSRRRGWDPAGARPGARALVWLGRCVPLTDGIQQLGYGTVPYYNSRGCDVADR